MVCHVNISVKKEETNKDKQNNKKRLVVLFRFVHLYIIYIVIVVIIILFVRFPHLLFTFVFVSFVL